MDLTGKTLGNYQVMEEVGRGGMAVVYRAYQASLNRYVALKVLPPQLAFDDQFVERFLREARAAASLNHPNIVVVHDVGEQSGTYYIVMEFLKGRTLKQLVQEEGALPPQRAARILDQTATALDYAHRHGFVHRDVKPANIFIGEDDRVTLTDFGIAKAASEAQQLTRTGMLVGTPEYMSPEQAEGGTVDYRTDLYALGIVLYQMLTGKVPFRGATPHAVLHAVIYEPPIPPRQLNPDLPPGVGAVLLQSVAKQPEQRFQRGAEMSAALETALRGQQQAGVAPVPPPPRRPGTGEEPKRSAKRTSPLIWVLVGLAAVLVLVLGGLAVLVIGGQGGDEPTAAITHVVIVPTATLDAGDAVSTSEAAATAGPSATATLDPASVLAPTEPLQPTATPPPEDTPVPPSDTPPSPSDTPLPPPTNTPLPPTATATKPPPPPPTATTPACAFDAQGAFSGLWQAYRGQLGCPLYAEPKVIQVAEQPFDNGHMFWRQDNDRIYVAYEAGAMAGSFDIYDGVWSEGDPDYSCAASPPPGRVQPVRGFGEAWCDLGGGNAQIGWGLSDEVGKWAGNGDPMVQDFERGLVFRDSDGTTKGLAYVFLPGGSFVRVAY